MKALKILLVTALVLSVLLTNGCVGKKEEGAQTTAPAITEAPIATEDLEAEFPDPTAETEDEIVVTEPDLEAEETVDLGEIL